eukprot:3458511-Prorocentrum_lima.AAC.1
MCTCDVGSRASTLHAVTGAPRLQNDFAAKWLQWQNGGVAEGLADECSWMWLSVVGWMRVVECG